MLDKDLNPDSEDYILETLEKSYKSLKFFCHTFMPDTFNLPFSKLHDQMFEILDDRSIQRFAIAAPRGFGKTMITLAYTARDILFGDARYVIPLSATGDSAIEQSENLKNELMSNEEIISIPDWAKLRPENREDSFGQKFWTTSSGVKVRPRGAQQQIRGGNWRGERPGRITGDDLEDDEKVLNEDVRIKLKEWFYSSVLNSVDIGSDYYRIGVLGTILHQNSLLNELLLNNKWESVRLEICNSQYVSNWPEKISDVEVKELADEYRDQGIIDVFYREYRNLPISTENRSFKAEHFQDYTDRLSEDQINSNSDFQSIVLMDPARTLKTGSANTAIAGLSVNVSTKEIFVREIDIGQMNPDELYERTFEMADRIKAIAIAPEVTGLNEYITYPLVNAMSMKGLFYELIEVKPREGKTGPRRSGGLIPLYRKGLIWHNRNKCRTLEDRLLQWPRPDKWDEIDAVSGIIFAMDAAEKFFTPIKTPEDIEEEYKKLNNEPELEEYNSSYYLEM